MHAPIPILRIFSEEKAREFYLGFLGFTLDWQHRFEPTAPLYLQVTRGELVLHLSEHYGDATPGAALLIPVDDITALHAELRDRDYAYARPGIRDEDWGRILEVADPFGNRLRFWQRGE
ncbi:glyoxalase superfamily protein [Janthinobacterium sp. RT4P48]|uniref:glyoxalase superfamily protein n=1 Tax=Janthinobacterium sp. RT4P48 TaxID=3424188 RepID=UPI003F1F5B4A